MERYESFLELFVRELDRLDSLLDLARRKRQAILDGDGDMIENISSSEESALEAVTDIRGRRLEMLSAILNESPGDRPGQASGGQRRYRLIKMAPDRLRTGLAEVIERYESKLMVLRREARINNTLLADRLRLIGTTLDWIQTTLTKKQSYEQTRKKQTADTSSALVDRVI